MESQTDGQLVQRALRQFSPDVFLHPVWIRFAVSSALTAEQTQPLICAAKQILAERDIHGTCSVLFLCAARQAWQGDYPGALESITQELKLAKRHHLSQAVVWGYWGAGAICTQQGEFQHAADYLRGLQAALKTSDWVLADLVEMIAQALDRMSGSGTQPALSASTSLLTNPFLQPLLHALIQWGQAQAPNHGQIPSYDEVTPISSDQPNRWRHAWQRLLRWVRGDAQPGRNGSADRAGAPVAANQVIPLNLLIPVSGGYPAPPVSADSEALFQPGRQQEETRKILQEPASSRTMAAPPPPENETSERADGVSRAPARTAANARASHPLPPAQAAPGSPSLAIYFFGSFRLYQDDQMVTDWPSQKSLAIFKYLAANRGKPVPKDILMDYFWTNAEPEVARRNLHQAIYALRQVLKRGWLDFPSILFENDCYLLNPELELWLDFEELDNHVQAGRRLEENGRIPQAMVEYGIAQELYPGDFLEDDLYEDWPNAQRTYYRTMYMDLLNRLCEYYILQKQYYPAIILCQKILAKDNCAEQAYCSLIQCYLAQGQRQLAIREYQTCVQVMKQELNLAPSKETRALYAQITATQDGARRNY